MMTGVFDWIVILAAILIAAFFLFSRQRPGEHKFDSVKPQPEPTLSPIFLTFDPTECPSTLQVESETDPSLTYTVDLAARTCTCPDFIKRRSHLGTEDIRRLCKHAVSALTNHSVLDKLPAIHRAILRDEYYPSFDILHAERIGEMDIAIGFKHDGSWLNIYAPLPSRAKKPREPRYYRYGYNADEDRWAYGEKPQQAATIAAVLKGIKK